MHATTTGILEEEQQLAVWFFVVESSSVPVQISVFATGF
jgi:hypothetical protein